MLEKAEARIRELVDGEGHTEPLATGDSNEKEA